MYVIRIFGDGEKYLTVGELKFVYKLVHSHYFSLKDGMEKSAHGDYAFASAKGDFVYNLQLLKKLAQTLDSLENRVCYTKRVQELTPNWFKKEVSDG